MIRQASHIMDKNFLEVSPLACVSTMRDLALAQKINYFPVVEDGVTIGAVTYKELMQAHPNRIAADAMTTNFRMIDEGLSIWEVKSLHEQEETKLLLVERDKKVVGMITAAVLDVELGKHIDLLTGLPRKEFIFYHALRLSREDKEISIIFIDVDNFGMIDKTHGHIYGDDVLREIALLLDQFKPEGTFLCRFGGDEFVLLAPFMIDLAAKTAGDLLNIIAAKTFSPEISVSVSAGISGGRRINPRSTDLYVMVQNLINIASLACSQAKRNGSRLCIKKGAENTDIA
jgi:diguanylate cyclase (GGDEF)-like protein